MPDIGHKAIHRQDRIPRFLGVCGDFCSVLDMQAYSSVFAVGCAGPEYLRVDIGVWKALYSALVLLGLLANCSRLPWTSAFTSQAAQVTGMIPQA